MKPKKTMLLAMLLAMIMSTTAVATTIVRPTYPRVQVSADGTTLTFINANTIVTSEISIASEYNEAPAWCTTNVTKVVIDPSFTGYLPTSTAHWFSGCTNLKTIEGLEYLRGDSVVRADNMFYDCKSLTTLDLSGWNTYKLTSCRGMFTGCTKLKTIYGNSWDILGNMTSAEKEEFQNWLRHNWDVHYMFAGCASLVGGSGTTYNSNDKKDYTYCHVDGGTSNPGYFTLKPATKAPYAVLNNGVLTLYYDNQRNGRVGTKYDITFGEAPDYRGNTAIKEIDIDSSMAALTPTSTTRLFEDLYDVYAIRHLENLNTSRVTDMSYMFYNCCSLGSIDLTGLNTSSVTDMTCMFGQCFTLTYADLSGLNTSNVTTMASMFYRCLSLTSVNLSSLNTPKLTDMSSMFNECSSLSTLNLGSFNTQRVTTMNGLFKDCLHLRLLNISSFNTSNVTDMAYMFKRCYSLPTITLNNFNTSKVTTMQGMFGQPMIEIVTQPVPAPAWYQYYRQTLSKIDTPAPQLRTVDISTFNTANVTNMTSMFEYQPSLTTIYVGNSWSTAKVSSGGNMFRYCDNIVGGSGTAYDETHTDQLYAHVDGGTANPGYLTLKGSGDGTGVKQAYAVLSGSTLTFYYDDLKARRTGTKYDLSTSYSGSSLPGWHANAATITAVVVNTSMKDYRPTSTAYWFYELSAMTAIAGLQNLNTADVTNMSFMFQKCESLKSLDVSSFNTANVTNMRAMFAYCPLLTYLDLSSFNTARVNNMRSMFNSDTALKNINLSSFNTEKVDNFSYMFYGCSALETLDISHFNTAKATTMRLMFRNCSALKTLELRNFNTAKVTDMYSMFYECSGLTRLDISTFTTDNVTTMRAMFYKCGKLTTLDVSGFNTTNVIDMGYMFCYCSSVMELCLSGFSTANDTTTEAMFSMCSALKTIYVKDNWNTSKVINDRNMFNACTSLVGGMGTAYNKNNISRTYARIDGGTSNPGYFTNLANTIPSGTQAYAMYTDKTLTFYYDNKAGSRTGTKYLIGSGYSSTNLPRWILDYYRRTFTKAVFDASFAAYRPTSTAFWFFNCTAMTTIEGISNLNTSQVTSMAEMFRYCSVLNNLDLRTFDTSNVTDMSCMFCYCWKLNNVNVSNFNTSKVTNMSHLFHQCPISSVNVNNFNTANVTDMSLMFAECKNLRTLYLKSFNTAKITNMTYMFLGDPDLTTIWASSDKWSTAKVSDGSYMFFGDTKLVGGRGTRYTPAHTDQLYARIDGVDCEPGYLTDDTAYGTREAYVNIVDTVMTFYYDDMRGCRQGETYLVGQRDNETLNGFKVPTWYHASINVNGVRHAVFDPSFAGYRPTSTACWFSDMYQLRSVSGFAYLNTSETTEMGSMFSNCMNLEYLDMSNLNTAKVTTTEMMFWSCLSLKAIDGIDTWNTESVTTMNHMFSGCWSLEKLNLYRFDTRNVTDMGGMFYNCTSLSWLSIRFNTEKVTYMFNMFSGCHNLEKLNVSSFNTANVTEAYDMFQGCCKLAELDVTNFDTRNMKYIFGMFSHCLSLKTLDLSSFDTRNAESIGGMFEDCTELQTIYVGKLWTTAAMATGQNVFFGCWKLVGGAGTTFDYNHTDYTYAHVDGGPSNPGYLTFKASWLKGDVNLDGQVGIGDIVAVTNVMAGIESDAGVKARADVNGDGQVGIGDIVAITNIMAGIDTGSSLPENVPAGVKAVDLGLPSGTLWANMNVGATYEEYYGSCFAWGDTQGYSGDGSDGHQFNWATYKWEEDGHASSRYINKYQVPDGTSKGCWYSIGGEFIGDNLTTLLPADDAAAMNWGGKWRMPTKEDFEELIDNTTNEWTSKNGVLGMKFTSKKNSNSIFLPAAGECWGSTRSDARERGFYWSATLADTEGAWSLSFRSTRVDMDDKYSRPYGMSVRPVRTK